jgi:hypothetical protein
MTPRRSARSWSAYTAQFYEKLHQQMAPWATGGAVGSFLNIGDTGPERIRSAFTPSDFSRLAAVKAAYDPTNLFRINHNIVPEGTDSEHSGGSIPTTARDASSAEITRQ